MSEAAEPTEPTEAPEPTEPDLNDAVVRDDIKWAKIIERIRSLPQRARPTPPTETQPDPDRPTS
jgi:hypothetical protein